MGPLDGSLAQLRISDTIRYHAPFEPPEFLPEPDSHTRVQFALDGDFRSTTASGAETVSWPEG